MAIKKTSLLIGAFLLFWLIFIGWGMLKTGLKLSQKKLPTPAEVIKKAEDAVTAVQKAKTEEPPLEPASVMTEARTIMVRTLKIKPVDFQDVLPVMGTIKGKTETQLRFEINGVIQKIHFREGEKVKKGSLLVSLDTKDAQLRLTYSKNKFNSTQSAYNSILKKLEVHKKLYDAGAIIKSKYEEVELECESARYQLETTKSETALVENELKKTALYANKDGVMGPREAEEGEFITTQDKVGSLLEIEEVLVEVGVVERDINKIKVGQKAKIYVDAYPNTPFEGTVERIVPVVEGRSRTLTVKINVPNPNGLLFPGMFSRAEIMIIQLKNALIIPANSLINAGAGVTLAPVIPMESLETTEDETKNGTVQFRRIKLGYMTSDYAEVTEGLKAGDLLVIESQGELKDNTKARILDIEEMSF